MVRSRYQYCAPCIYAVPIELRMFGLLRDGTVNLHFSTGLCLSRFDGVSPIGSNGSLALEVFCVLCDFTVMKCHSALE